MTFDDPIPPLRPIDTVPFVQDGRDYLLLRDPQGIAEQQIAVALQAWPILAHLDGRHTVREIANKVRRSHRLEVNDRQVHDIVSMLDGAMLLHSEGFLKHRLGVEEAFRQSSVRLPTLAGGGYPVDPEELSAFLNRFEAAGPPDDFAPETPLPGKRLRGLLAPHIDYHRGGESYGRLYRQLRPLLPDPSEGPLLIGVIGVAHCGVFEPMVATGKNFRTPLGDFAHDREALGLLRERLGDGVLREDFIHKSEHSVEIQVPWLQHLLGERDDVTFLPLLAGTFDAPGNGGPPSTAPAVQRTLQALREVEATHPGPVLWLASVDFAHVGPAFGDDQPVSDRDRARVEKKDMQALETLHDGDPEAWWRQLAADGNARRVCGMNATYLAMHLLAGSSARVLDYQQAVSDDRLTMVSYAAAVFQE